MARYDDLTIYDYEMMYNYTQKLSGVKCFYFIFGILTGIILGLQTAFAFLSMNIISIILAVFEIT